MHTIGHCLVPQKYSCMDCKKESDVPDYVNQKQLLSVSTDGSFHCALELGL